MNRHMILYLELKRLRDRQSRRWEPIPLQLPANLPYWPQPDSEEDDEKKEQSGRVVIIDMNDYSEVEN